jgi:hypothetical protein
MHHLDRLSCLPVALFLALAACGGDADPGDTPTPPAATPTRPRDPAQNDPAFTVTGAPVYLLAGDTLTPATPSFALRVAAPAGTEALDLWVDDAAEPLPLAQDGAEWTVTVDATPLSLGKHRLLLSRRGADEGAYRAELSKGHALYVVISTDWDFSDVDDRVLAHHEEMHVAHPELKITHLIGPYTFTDPEVSPARREQITGWAKTMRDTYSDEIGLHVHPRCEFVEAAGLTCLSGPSVAYPQGDPSGYTVRLGAYTRDQWDVMFAKADEIWNSIGFGKPTSFRAGAWTLELSTAQALADAGFLVDSSANNWKYMREEWLGYEIFTWNEAQWGPIGDTSQPYHPTEDSILPGGDGQALSLLEVPDNGCMVDYWTVDEMTAIFEANWTEGPLAQPTQVSTGFHPAPTDYYSPDEYQRLDAFFTHVDQYLASKQAGPVVYINMSDAARVWQAAP